MDQGELKKILDDHKLWLKDEGGKRAYLLGADLWRADLREAKIKMTQKEQILQAIGIQIEDDI